MFDIGWTEIIVVVIVTILVVGPKELPGLLRTVGKTVGNMRRMAGDFQNQFNEALKEAEMDEVKNTIGDIRKLDPRTAVKDAVTKELGSSEEWTSELSSQLNETKQEISSSLDASQGAASTDVADLVDEDVIAEMPVAAANAPSSPDDIPQAVEASVSDASPEEPSQKAD